MKQLRYPCTGAVQTHGFAAFLEQELGAPRHNIRQFAQELASVFSIPEPTLVNSGSSANLAAALALFEDTGPGEAIVAGFTFPTTMSALLTAGYSLRVVDCEPGGFCLDPRALARAMSPSTKVVCVTHFLGFPARMPEIHEQTRGSGVRILQDACETMNLHHKGQPLHTFGDVTTWSFYHPHHLSAFGGGAVITHNPEMRQRIESITHWGRACTCHYDPHLCQAPEGKDHNFWYVRQGHNLEMSELNACFGRFQLQSWELQERRRRDHYEALSQALDFGRVKSKCKTYPATADQGTPFVFPITLPEPPGREFYALLRASDLEVRTLMGGVITDQPAYQSVPQEPLSNCRDLAARSFMVGIHQTLNTNDLKVMGDILRETILQCT